MRRTALFRSPVYLDHDTGRHPENAARLVAIDADLAARDLLTNRPAIPFEPAPDHVLERVHSSRLIAGLEALAEVGGGWLDADTVVAPRSVEAARLACGAATAAVDAFGAGTIDRAFVLGRPPGHHATPTRAMGFCLFNTAAVAAAHARSAGFGRVAIVDWDVHHGNGTQDAFYEDPSVLYCSLHQSPLYPFSGRAGERGSGPGNGLTVNVPLRPNTAGPAYIEAFDRQMLPALRTFQPTLLIISAGYDAHIEDPVGGLRLTDDTFRTLARRAVDLADTACEGRVLMILEGGYHAPTLARCVADAVEIMDGP